MHYLEGYSYYKRPISMHSFRSYWSRSWPFTNDCFSSVMSSRRYELILKFLHLNDSASQPARGEPGYDRLYKVRPLLDTVIENFKDSYVPTQNLSIDESIVGFKGRLSFIQYMPKKPHEWGIKAWVLADSSNGYAWGWKLYSGKEEGANDALGLSHRVVLELRDDDRLQHKGYIIFTDNFYTSPALFTDLQLRGFEACGTVRINRRGLPESIRTVRLQKGEVHSIQTSDDHNILALKWRDKRDVTLLSTYHDDSMIEKRRRTRAAEDGVEVIQKPTMVEDYNQHMGGVDKSELYITF